MRGGVTDMKQVIAIILSVCIAATALSAAVFLTVCGESNQPTKPGPEFFRELRCPSFGIYWPPVFTEDQIKTFLVLSEEPSQADVYRAVVPHLDEEYARKLARKLDLEGDPQWFQPPVLLGPEYDLRTEEAILNVRVDGIITYRRTDSGETGGAADLSDERAKEIAIEFLSERGLMPETAQVSSVSLDEDGHGKRVLFSDSRLRNPGLYIFATPWIVVEISKMGTVEAVEMSWPDLVVVGRYPIVSEADAYRRIAEGLFSPSPRLMEDESRTVEISRYETGYKEAYKAEGGNPRASVYFVPFYRFYQDEWKWIDVPALPNEYLLPPDVEWPREWTPEPTPASGE